MHCIYTAHPTLVLNDYTANKAVRPYELKALLRRYSAIILSFFFLSTFSSFFAEEIRPFGPPRHIYGHYACVMHEKNTPYGGIFWFSVGKNTPYGPENGENGAEICSKSEKYVNLLTYFGDFEDISRKYL